MGDSKVDLGGGGSRLNRDGYQDKTVFVNTDEPFYGPPAEGAAPFSRRTSSSFRKKEAGKLSFGIGGFEATPRVFFEGSQTGRTPTVSLPEGDVLYDQQNFNVSGKLGADVRTPGGDTLGASAAGDAYRGGIEFPDAMKKYGAENVTYNSRGVELSELGAYYQMEGGPRFEASSRPTADPTADPEHSARVSYTRRFEDGGEIGYYPEGPPSKVDLGAGAAKVAADIAALGPYLEGNYMAQLGLDTLSLDRILDIGAGYNVDGFYAPQDATLPDKADDYDKIAFREMVERGRSLSALFDPKLTGTKTDPLRNYLAYSYPDVNVSGDIYVEPFDSRVGFPKPKEEEYLNRDPTEEEARASALGVLAHELTHTGDVFLSRNFQADDEPNLEGRFELGENYARLVDIMNRDRGLGILQTETGRAYESKAVSEGIRPRYSGLLTQYRHRQKPRVVQHGLDREGEGDPFAASVRKKGFFPFGGGLYGRSRERLDPEDFEKAVLSHPAQGAAKRELFRRLEARTPMGGYAYGGEVSKEPSAISSVNAGLGDMEPILSAARGAMQRREAKPAESLFGGGVRSLPTSAAPIPDRASSDRDPRSEANASLMLKKAGLSAPKNFADFINGTNPDVLAQFDRLMGRGRSPRRSGSMGIGSLPNQKSPAGVS